LFQLVKYAIIKIYMNVNIYMYMVDILIICTMIDRNFKEQL